MSQDAVDHGSQRKQFSENTDPETSLFRNCWGWVRGARPSLEMENFITATAVSFVAQHLIAQTTSDW